MKLSNYLVIFSLFLVNFSSLADAYCSLRDPVAQIKQLYPNRTNQLSIVKEIDSNARIEVQEKLPNNDLHFGELGRHTLYVALQDNKTLGYVHVRSEQSKWGLVEIIWAIDENYRITDFAFQRCRSPKKKLLNNQQFKNMFIGKNFAQLKHYLSADGLTANKTLLSKASSSPELANVILRCALKTLLLTHLVWHNELQSL